jgi:hypothetical protein
VQAHGVELLASFDNRGEREVVFSSGWTLALPHGLDIHQSPAGKVGLRLFHTTFIQSPEMA